MVALSMALCGLFAANTYFAHAKAQPTSEILLQAGFVIAFAILNVVFLRRALSAHVPALVIDEAGIWDLRLRDFPIKWQHFTSLSIFRARFGVECISLASDQATTAQFRHSVFSRILDMQPDHIHIEPRQLGITAEMLADMIRSLKAQVAPEPQG